MIQNHLMEVPPVLPQPVLPIKRKSRKKFFIIVLVFLALLGYAIYAGLTKKDPVVNVQTEKVARHTLTETVVANGKIYPVKQVHISPEVSGEITDLPVKEGQFVHKGDLLLKIKPEFYIAAFNQAKASYQSSQAAVTTAAANLEKAEEDFKRNKELFAQKLLPESDFIAFKVARDIALAQLDSAQHQVEVAKANVDSAQDSLDKTTIVAPMDGTITTLNSQLGERVLGTVQNAGTDIMIISDLSAIEARVDIGEMDIVLVKPGQKARLEVDSFKKTKFAGVVTDVANSSEGLNATAGLGGSSSSSASATATQFQVRIRLTEGEQFHPGMSVTAEIETRTRTNTLTAPIASVTTRVPKSAKTNTTDVASQMNTNKDYSSLAAKTEKTDKPIEVVFIVDGDHVKSVPVKLGIGDDNYWEITEGVKEGDEIVTGNYRAINHDLDDGKKIKRTPAGADSAKAKS